MCNPVTLVCTWLNLSSVQIVFNLMRFFVLLNEEWNLMHKKCGFADPKSSPRFLFRVTIAARNTSNVVVLYFFQ